MYLPILNPLRRDEDLQAIIQGKLVQWCCLTSVVSLHLYACNELTGHPTSCLSTSPDILFSCSNDAKGGP